jgi:cellulose synthase/poly-beta-1,6-N-acetylglucosamine synthase-like glycosyltransferase
MEPSLLFTGTVITVGFLVAFYLAYFLLMLHFSRRPSNTRKSKIFPFVSLVVATFNEENIIQRKLQNTEELDYPKHRLEVIVVDSASSDRTRQIVKEYIANKPLLNVRLLEQQERTGKASALNYAWHECKGEIFVISDADCLLEHDALTTIISNFSDPRVGAVTGRQVLLNYNQSFATRMERSYRSFYEVIRVGESNFDSTTVFHGELSAFRADLVDKLNADSVCDDIEMAFRIRKKGYKTLYDRNAIFHEYAPPTIGARSLQKRRRGQGNIQNLFRFSGMLFNSNFGWFGMVILPSEFFMNVISPLLIFFAIGLSCLTIASYIFYLGLGGILLILFAAATLGILAHFNAFTKNLLITAFSFLNSQACLLEGFLSLAMGKKSHKWKKVDAIRELWKVNMPNE